MKITYIAQKMKFAIKDFSSKCDQIRSFRSAQWQINGRDKLWIAVKFKINS